MKDRTKKLRSAIAALALGLVAGMANGQVEVTEADGSTSLHATLAAAHGACSPGATLRLLSDESATVTVKLTKQVTIDLNGFTFKNPNANAQNAWLFKIAAAGIVVTNGTLEAKDCCITMSEGFSNSGVTARDVTFKGVCVLYGTSTGTLRIEEGCVVQTQYLVSGSNSNACKVEVYGGVVAPSISIVAAGKNPTPLALYRCYLTVEPQAAYLSPLAECTTLEEPVTVLGIACSYRVDDKVGEAVYVYGPGESEPRMRYASLLSALSNCPEGGLIRLNENVTVDKTLTVGRSLTLDLNGHTITNTRQSIAFFEFAAGTTVAIVGNGGALTSPKNTNASNFGLNLGTSLTVSGCKISGNCPVWSATGGTLTLENVTMDTTIFSSSNGKAAMNVLDGTFTFTKWRDGAVDTGTTLCVSGGLFVTYLQTGRPAQLLAEGRTVVYQKTNQRYQVLPTAEAEAIDCDGLMGGVRYTDLARAITDTVDGSELVLLKDWPQTLGFGDLRQDRSIILDLGGHTVSGNDQFFRLGTHWHLRVRNGVLREMASQASIFGFESNTGLILESTVTLDSAPGCTTCGAYLNNASNVSIEIDGATLNIDRLISWSNNTGRKNCVVTVRGDGTSRCDELTWPGTRAQDASNRIIARGGRYGFDPSAYLPADNSCVVVHKASAAPACTYRVLDFAALAETGWSLRADDPLLGAAALAGSKLDIAANPVVVSFEAMPERMLTVADFSSVALGEGAALGFVRPNPAPKGMRVTYANGLLSAGYACGLTILFY